MIRLLLLVLGSLNTVVTESTRRCHQNFDAVDGDRCYELANATGLTFDQQLQHCRKQGADLPSGNGFKESSSLLLVRNQPSAVFFFIGLQCGSDGTWQWTDGSPYDSEEANSTVDRVNCQYHNSPRFVFVVDGRWKEWKDNDELPSIVVCAAPKLISAQYGSAEDGSADDENPDDSGTSWVISVLLPILGCIAIISLILYCCWRKRAKAREVNEMLRSLMAKMKKYEEQEKEREANMKKDGWEIDRKFVAVDWEKKLGNGAFGTVYLGRVSATRLPEKAAESIIQVIALKKNEDRVAVKMLHESADRTADLAFREEIELMKNIGYHERLMNMLACVTESSPPMLIVEFCSKGDLLGHMKRCREYMLDLHDLSELDYNRIITEKQQFMFAVQIAYGLEYLSNRGYVHRDIAARNILVDHNDSAKIGDFGLCRKLEENQNLYLARGGRLPLKWMSPESLRDYEMSTVSDVWSYGVLLFEIVILGGSPYAEWSLAEILPRLEAGERMARPDNCPDSLYDIMTACWRLRPNQRPNFTQIRTQVAQALEKEDVATMEKDLNRLIVLLNQPGMKLPDGGANLRRKIEELTTRIENARLAQPARRVAPPESKGKLQVIDAPTNPDGYNKQIVDDGLGRKKLMGGVMTYDRMENVKRVTKGTLDKMHKEVTAQPEGEETQTPRGLRVELMGHQKTGLTWMMWREKQQAPGGILADDMGLGKTISMISLVLNMKNERLEKKDDETYEEQQAKYKKMCNAKGWSLVASHSTLVIAPASVIYQWKKEIEERVEGNRLSVYVFHGPKDKREDQPEKLAEYDIVITTYDIIRSELTEKVDYTRDDEDSDSDDDDEVFGKKAAVPADGKSKRRVAKSQVSVLTKVHWDRIILDEAHNIKNRISLISKAVCRLPGRKRWALTGTPVHNSLYDLFSLVRFLRVQPFDELTLWEQYIMNDDKKGDRLNILVKSMLLRRLKNQLLVALKPKLYEVHELELDGLEKGIYDLMFKAVQSKVSTFMQQQKEEEDINLFGRIRRRKGEKKEREDEAVVNPFIGGEKFSCFLDLLLRLRQSVVHLSLTKNALNLSTFEGLPMNSNDEILDAELSQLSLDEHVAGNGMEKKVATKSDVDHVFTDKFLSTKIRVLLDKLDLACTAGDKCVVVSQWTSVFKIIKYHIVKRDIKYTEITGKIATDDRQKRVDSFNRTDGDAQVMLLSLTAGGVGLNLVGGNHLFLVDLHWNPALEAQACDRIYRLGQTKNVFIHKLLSKNTIEESILQMQNKKSALAKSVLEGAAKKDLNKLTMDDLRFLFNLDGEQKKKEQVEEAARKAMSSLPSSRPGPSTHSASAHNYNQSVYGGRQTNSSTSSSKDVITL